MVVPAHVQSLLVKKAGFSPQVGRHRRALAEHAAAELEEDKPRLERCWRSCGKDVGSGFTPSELRKALPEALDADSAALTLADIHILTAFTGIGSGGKATKGGFYQAVMVWRLVQAEREGWASAVRRETGGAVIEAKHVHVLMTEINGTATTIEAAWAMEVAGALATFCEDFEKALLLALAYWVITATPNPEEGLIREKLVERLLLEDMLGRGCLRFLSLLCLFVLSCRALTHASKGGDCRGIRTNLVTQYSLDSIGDVTSTSDIHDFLKQFSAASATMAPLSNEYFDQGLELRLTEDIQSFSAPQTLPDADLQLGRAFTLTAWLQLNAEDLAVPPQGLPILRKALNAEGAGSDLACLSWNFPLSITFGAHDFRAGAVAGPQQ